jgi:hypothetical protein
MNLARFFKRPALVALALAGLTASASGYYHFLQFTTIDGVLRAVPEKFDLTALYNKTLFFYVSQTGPSSLAAGDSFDALLSQIRLAAATWNSVPTSDLRLAYGGLFAPGTTQNTPHMEVIFGELPPGVLAMGGPVTTTTAMTAGPNPFVPVTYSVLTLNKDLSQQLSYQSWSFTVILHEMGHALGLQHSMTSSAMATLLTRATSRAKPLGDDDIAGLSALYPKPQFAQQFGSLSGRVTLDGNGVHLASVVALTPTGDAVGTLTNPDGTYEIKGLLPRQYYVYVQPLPPATQEGFGPADIVLPLDATSNPIPAGPAFKTEFYPGTVNMAQAMSIRVAAGETAKDVDFAVQASAGPSIYEVATYSYPGDLAVKPAYVNVNDIPRWYLVAGGAGLIENGSAKPGLNVSVMGGATVVGASFAADWAPGFLEVDLLFNLVSGTGPRHLLFSTPDELYVLPSGLIQVMNPPPSIASATPGVDANGNPLVTIAGKNLGPTTKILFDGVPAVSSVYDKGQNQIVATPPVGASKHVAAITALNNDGQISLFVDEDPAEYTYPERAPESFTVSPAALPAGIESMVEINGVNTAFAQGQTSVGFGTSDIVVKRVWVMSPTKLRASVFVAPSAKAVSTLATITTGLESLVQPAVFQVQPPNPAAASISSDLINPNGRATVYPGSMAIVPVSNLPLGSSITATLNDIPVSARVADAGNQILMAIPADFPPGMAVLRVQVAGAAPAPPVVVSIDAAPPVIEAVWNGQAPLAADATLAAGDALIIQIGNVFDAAALADPARFRLTIGGVDHQPVDTPKPVDGQPNTYLATFILSPLIPAGQQVSMTVAVDGRTSDAYQLQMR